MLGLLFLYPLAEVGHVFFHFLHDAQLHLDLHVSFLLTEVLFVLVLPIDEVVLSDFGLRLLGHALDLSLLFSADSHDASDCLADGAAIVLCLFFQDAYHLGSREDEAYLLHEIGPQ